MRRCVVPLVLLCALSASVASVAGSADLARARWVIRDLGTLGGSYSVAWTINERGQVVGTSRTAEGARRVFLWEHGTMTDLGRFGWDVGGGPLLLSSGGQVAWDEQGRGATVWLNGVISHPPISVIAMNDRGELAGQIAASSTGKVHHAAVWESGQLRDLGVLPGDSWSRADVVANSGIVGGVSYPADGAAAHAFMWAGGKMRALAVPHGFSSCSPVDVNDAAQVLGYCTSQVPWRLHSFLWTAGRPRDLGVLGAQWVFPIAFNDRGQVIGRTRLPRGSRERAFLWQNGRIRDLGTLGGKGTFAADINNRGQIVGASYTRSGNLHAFVWEHGVMTDLARRGQLSLSEAFSINERGEIAGYSRTGERGSGGSSPPQHAVIWTQRPS